MIIFVRVIAGLAFKLAGRNQFVSLDPSEKFLVTTDRINKATDFDLVHFKDGVEFLIYRKGTVKVWDDPGATYNGKIYLHPKHGKDNQRWKFIFHHEGGFSLISRNLRVEYLPSQDAFKMVPLGESNVNFPGFELIDLDKSYKNTHEFYPIKNRDNAGLKNEDKDKPPKSDKKPDSGDKKPEKPSKFDEDPEDAQQKPEAKPKPAPQKPKDKPEPSPPKPETKPKPSPPPKPEEKPKPPTGDKAPKPEKKPKLPAGDEVPENIPEPQQKEDEDEEPVKPDGKEPGSKPEIPLLKKIWESKPKEKKPKIKPRPGGKEICFEVESGEQTPETADMQPEDIAKPDEGDQPEKPFGGKKPLINKLLNPLPQAKDDKEKGPSSPEDENIPIVGGVPTTQEPATKPQPEDLPESLSPPELPQTKNIPDTDEEKPEEKLPSPGEGAECPYCGNPVKISPDEPLPPKNKQNEWGYPTRSIMYG